MMIFVKYVYKKGSPTIKNYITHEYYIGIYDTRIP